MPKAITTDPDIRGGVPCVAGTRITVKVFLQHVNHKGIERAAMMLGLPLDMAEAAMAEIIDHYSHPPEPSPSIDAAAREIVIAIADDPGVVVIVYDALEAEAIVADILYRAAAAEKGQDDEPTA